MHSVILNNTTNMNFKDGMGIVRSYLEKKIVITLLTSSVYYRNIYEIIYSI